MPNTEELKAAVIEAVAKEREQFVAAVKKAVEEALAGAQTNVSEADAKIILDAIASVVPDEPTA